MDNISWPGKEVMVKHPPLDDPRWDCGEWIGFSKSIWILGGIGEKFWDCCANGVDGDAVTACWK